jgi:outer membrane lipoprotein-sorting protein
VKKIFLCLSLICLILLTGCGKKSEKDIIKDFQKKVLDSNAYYLTGKMELVNNEDVFNYNISVSYKKEDYYKIELVNSVNDHKQVILRNDEGVYIVTPSLNKSFKFQSDWPNNNSQIYFLQSIINDIKSDKDKKFEVIDGNYVLTTKVNYPNNNQLVKQKIIMNKDLQIKQIEVMDSNNISQMIMKINSIDYESNFNDDFFKLDSIIDKIDDDESNNKIANDKSNNKIDNTDNKKEPEKDNNEQDSDEKTNTTSTIDDIIYPLYIPSGTVLTGEEKVSKTDGERVILTFGGEKPFTLVEETTVPLDEFTVVPTYGDPYLLIDTVAALSNNSINWVSNGIEYYIVSDVMNQNELIEVAKSVNTVSVLK